jgi:hypothetical protein
LNAKYYVFPFYPAESVLQINQSFPHHLEAN